MCVVSGLMFVTKKCEWASESEWVGLFVRAAWLWDRRETDDDFMTQRGQDQGQSQRAWVEVVVRGEGQP